MEITADIEDDAPSILCSKSAPHFANYAFMEKKS